MCSYIRLRELLRFAKSNVRFFDDHIPDCIFGEIGEPHLLAIYHQLPVIDKDDMRKDYRDFVDKSFLEYDLEQVFDTDKNSRFDYTYEWADQKVIAEYTSGTTGRPFVVLKTLRERLQLGKNLWSLRNGFFRAQPSDFFYFMRLGRDVYPFPFPKCEEDDTKMEREIGFLETSPYTWWHCYPQMLFDYMRYLASVGAVRGFGKLKVIEINGAFVSDEEKSEIADAFKCLVANNYGCKEVWAIGYDCPAGSLHVNERNIVFELVDDKGRVITDPNIAGHVVVTSVVQRSMPFIRYMLGDMAYYQAGLCSCGNTARRIVLQPSRHLIQGTQIYGNQHFRAVIVDLIQLYGLNQFDAITVCQTERGSFSVNIAGNREKTDLIEEAFVSISNELLGDADHRYQFTYPPEAKEKSVFTSKC